MKFKILKGAILSILVIVITFGVYSTLISFYLIEIDAISIATNIVDGDTFYIATGDRIRLADVDTPESGEWGFSEASQALRDLIDNKKVYLDIDDIGWTDRYGRLVCLVYVDYNSTHYLNVNAALLAGHYASLWDHYNEFDPNTWNLLVLKLNINGMLRLLLVSFIIGLVTTYIINLVVKKIRKLLPF